MLTVYHGSTYRVEQPLAGVCRPNLDFGVGFYLTDLKEQAVRVAQYLFIGYRCLPQLFF